MTPTAPLAGGDSKGTNPRKLASYLGAREGTELADLGNQADRGRRVDAARAAEPADQRRPLRVARLLVDERIQAGARRQDDLVAGQVLTEHRVRGLFVTGQKLRASASDQRLRHGARLPGSSAIARKIARKLLLIRHKPVCRVNELGNRRRAR
jgi:hypothetical protein